MEKEEKKNKKENKELKHLEEENHKLKNDLKESSEKVLRLAAEMQNYKKRNETEKSNMLKYANEDLAKSLLPILDNFERAIRLDDNDLSDEVSKFLSGFKMIYGSFVNVLNNIEVKEIECDGLEFDPVYHQAVLTEKDETKPSGVILEVLQKGYMYKDKVIRPAMVKVNE
ncbi:MAG: nucleotide exchange factor GrpE [Clostridiaceae bacterium]|jgi:molecular chaperone GrpE|nr:MAG: nucleotide exchange factor GrpE [Clostridiaceae bacterium]